MKQDTSLFNIMSQKVMDIIQNDHLCLEGTFYLNRNSGKQVKLLLTNNYIAFSDHFSNQNTYRYYTTLDYELKFEVFYEQDLQNTNDLSPHSNKIGFTLHRAGTTPVQFIIANNSLVDVWIKYLGQCLNQLGFHRLYAPVKKLGKGGFATVYQVERVTDKQHFAVKAFSKNATINSQNESHRLTLFNQIKIMRQLDSPNIIKLQGVYESENSLYVILQLLSAGQLHSRINKRKGQFTLGQIKHFMVGLIKGIKQIHDNGIMHRDLKPQNIMLRSQNSLEPVIVDFGLAAYVESEDYIFYRCGTPGYVAPQITTLMKGQKVDSVCDIFSAGVIFNILLVKKPLFEGRKFQQVYQNNRKMQFNLNSPLYQNVDRQAMDLLQKMLRIDPNQRIRANDVLKHPFLNGWLMQDEKEELSPSSSTSRRK